jgi:hypothetical protein
MWARKAREKKVEDEGRVFQIVFGEDAQDDDGLFRIVERDIYDAL